MRLIEPSGLECRQSGRAASPVGSDLNEPDRTEVTVERERLPNPLAPHDGEARGVDEGVGALIVPAKPGPRLSLDRIVDAQDGQPGGGIHGVEVRDGRGVPFTATEERPCLTDDVVGGQQGSAGCPKPDGGVMVGIPAESKRHPE